MRPVGSAEELERRRYRSMALVRSGLSLNEVARRVGCYASSVLRWRDAYRRSGKQGLRAKPVPGRPARLSQAQQAKLLRYLLAGAMAHGYRTELWTTLRVAEVIRARFGVRYHRDHVGRLLHRLNWSCQKPERRAMQRDEAAIVQWKVREWPRIKKRPRGWGPILPS